MATNCWRPEAMRRFLLVFTMAVSATGQSTNPTIPPTLSEEPNGLNKPFVIVAVVLVAAILLGFLVIILVYCCRRNQSKATRRPVGISVIGSEDYVMLKTKWDRSEIDLSTSRSKWQKYKDRSEIDLDMEMYERDMEMYERDMEMYERDMEMYERGKRMSNRLKEGAMPGLSNVRLSWSNVHDPIISKDFSEQISLSQSRPLKLDEEIDVSLFLYKEKYFDRNGGVLVVPEAEVSLSIPPGALTEGCIISINVVPTRSVTLPGQGLVPRLTPLVICEPDGLHFEKAVMLILPHCGIIDDPVSHTVHVDVGRKLQEKYFSRDMTWIKEDVEYKLTQRFCHLFLKHFSGVNVNMSDTKEKMLRAIPFASAIDEEKPNEDVILNMWLCNDLAADYLTLVKNEIKNKNIPLDSYDTFRLNTSDHQQKTYIEVTTEGVNGSNWLPKITTKNLDIHGLTTTAKSKCTFRYVNQGGNKNYFYTSVRIEQKTENDERESLFVLRKRKSDLTLKSECLKSDNAFLATNCCLSDLGRPPSEHPPKSCIAVPFVDSMIDHTDDIILTLWLLSEESTEQMLSNLEKEQGLLQKMKFDTENTFTIRDAKKPVTCTVLFRQGNWNPNSNKMVVDIGKVLRGNRAKFPFICRKKTNDTAEKVDVEMTIAQEGEGSRTEFMKRTGVEDFLFGSTKSKKITLLKEKVEASRKFDALCQALIGSLSENDCRYLATYFDFQPAHIEEVLSSNRPADTLIRMLQQRLLFTASKLGWFQNALIRIYRNDLAETVGRFKMESQGVDGEKP